MDGHTIPYYMMNRRDLRIVLRKSSFSHKTLGILSNALIYILLVLALLTPCMPKIGISENITIFPVEIHLLFGAFIFMPYIKFKIQKILLTIWLIILLSTLFSQLSIINAGSVMRCLKEIIYIPIVYLVYISKWVDWKHLSYIFCLAFVINILFIFSIGFSFSNLNIWDSDTLFSGLSGHYLNLNSFDIVKIEGKGSHGVWASYCVLALAATLIGHEQGTIKNILLYLVVFFVIISIGMTVSREGLLSLIILFLSYMLVKLKTKNMFSFFLFLFSAIIVVVLIYFVIDKYGGNIAIVQKLLYTQDAISATGEESNIALRIGAWRVYAESILRNPIMLIFGYGYNYGYYQSFLDFKVSYQYVPIPESFFIECVLCGGLVCLFFGIRFWRCFYNIIDRERSSNIRLISKGLFLGLLVGSIFSGAAIFADLLYCQFLIFLGIFLRKQNIFFENTTNYRSLRLRWRASSC